MKAPGERDMQSALQNKDLAFQASGVQPYCPQSSSKWGFWQKVITLTHQPPAQALSSRYKKKMQDLKVESYL